MKTEVTTDAPNAGGGFWRRKVGAPLRALLSSGMTPEKIAQCLVLGAALSLFPVLGTTTILCAAAALWLKLNLPAIQAVNWLLGGVQLALLIPFMRVGEALFGHPPLPLDAQELLAMVRADFWGFLAAFWRSILDAVAGWAVLVLPSAVATYAALVFFFRRPRAA